MLLRIDAEGIVASPPSQDPQMPFLFTTCCQASRNGLVVLFFGWLVNMLGAGLGWVGQLVCAAPRFYRAHLFGIEQLVAFFTVAALHDRRGTRHHRRDLLAVGPDTGTERSLCSGLWPAGHFADQRVIAASLPLYEPVGPSVSIPRPPQGVGQESCQQLMYTDLMPGRRTRVWSRRNITDRIEPHGGFG